MNPTAVIGGAGFIGSRLLLQLGGSSELDISLLDLDESVGSRAGIGVLDEALGGEARTIDWFNWKHRLNPQGSSIIAIAKERITGRAASVRAMWRADPFHGGHRVVAYQPCDTATRKEFRRQGPFRRLTELAIDQAISQGANMVYNFPNRNSGPATIRAGWTDLGGMGLLLRPFRWSKVGWTGIRTRGQLGRFRDEAQIARPFPSEPRDWDRWTDARSEWPEGIVHGPRDGTYLRWRFGEHLRYHYHLLEHGDGAIIGRAGWRGDLREFFIVCWLGAAPTESVTATACVRETGMKFSADLATAPIHDQHPLRWGLPRFGLLPMPIEIRFMARVLDGVTQLPELRWGLDGSEKDTN